MNKVKPKGGHLIIHCHWGQKRSETGWSFERKNPPFQRRSLLVRVVVVSPRVPVRPTRTVALPSTALSSCAPVSVSTTTTSPSSTRISVLKPLLGDFHSVFVLCTTIFRTVTLRLNRKTVSRTVCPLCQPFWSGTSLDRDRRTGVTGRRSVCGTVVNLSLPWTGWPPGGPVIIRQPVKVRRTRFKCPL